MKSIKYPSFPPIDISRLSIHIATLLELSIVSHKQSFVPTLGGRRSGDKREKVIFKCNFSVPNCICYVLRDKHRIAHRFSKFANGQDQRKDEKTRCNVDAHEQPRQQQ